MCLEPKVLDWYLLAEGLLKKTEPQPKLNREKQLYKDRHIEYRPIEHWFMVQRTIEDCATKASLIKTMLHGLA